MARSRTLTGPVRAAPGQVHPDLRDTGPMPRCSAPATPTSSRRRTARRTWSTSADVRLRNRGRCTLGRETAIQPMAWGDDGWLRTTDGEGLPTLEAAAPELPAHVFPAAPAARGLRRPRSCRIDFQWLRSPWPDELFSLTARPGHLRLFGRETIGQPLPPGAGRAAAAVALLQRARRRWTSSPSTSSRWPGWSATTTAPSSTTSTCRTTRPSASHCASCRRCPTRRQADAFTPPIADSGRTAR